MPVHAALSVPKVRYEVRVGGRLGVLLTRAVGSSDARHEQSRTRLVITSEADLSLTTLVARLHDLGIEVEYVRATPSPMT